MARVKNFAYPGVSRRNEHLGGVTKVNDMFFALTTGDSPVARRSERVYLAARRVVEVEN